MYYEEPLIDPRAEVIAEAYGLNAKELDWHVEAVHGWEPHDTVYQQALHQSARCLLNGGCEDEVDNEEEKD